MQDYLNTLGVRLNTKSKKKKINQEKKKNQSKEKGKKKRKFALERRKGRNSCRKEAERV